MLSKLHLPPHPAVLVGTSAADDAGVYRLSDELALITTLDFFTPIVDDPRMFGAIAAANALSDVYAMGGTPIFATNIVCFPLQELGADVLGEVLQGGLEVLREADVQLLGGHSVRDPELKYGLSVTGTIHPDRIWLKAGAQEGDVLILTKPLGTGIIAQGAKKERAGADEIAEASAHMRALNRSAANTLLDAKVHACTDITGFGLAGHALQMLEESGPLDFVLSADDLPLLKGAARLAEAGIYPGGLKKNRSFAAPRVDTSLDDNDVRSLILYDPQTSGGLFVALAPSEAATVVAALGDNGVGATIVGHVAAGSGRLRIESEAN